MAADGEGIVYVTVEGVGSDSTASKGLAWYYGIKTFTDTDYEWAEHLLEPPSSIESRADPRTGEWSVSSFRFELRRHALPALHFLWQPVEFVDQVATTFNNSIQTIVLDDGSPATGDVVWIGDEAIKLGTKSGGAPWTYTSSTRGYYGTDAAYHGDGDKVFDANPALRLRKVELKTRDTSDAEVIRWRGYLEPIDNPTPGTKITLATRELLAVASRVEVNLHNRNHATYAGLQRLDRSGGSRVLGWIPYNARRDRQAPPSFVNDIPSRTRKGFANGEPGVLRIDDALVFAKGLTAPVGWNFEDAQSTPRYPIPIMSTQLEQLDSGDAWEIEDVWEVFLISEDVDNYLTSERGFSCGCSPTENNAYPYHPLTIVANFLMSNPEASGSTGTYDNYGPFWGMGLGWLFSQDAIDELDELIAKTAHVKVDQVLLGWDGEPVAIWDWCIELLRGYGLGLGFDETGLLRFYTFGRMDVEQWDFALNTNQISILPDTLSMEGSQGAMTDGIQTKLFAGPDKTADITVNINGVSRRASRLGLRSETEIDLTTIHESNLGKATTLLLNRSVMTYYAMPVIRVRCGDSQRVAGQDFSHGQYVTLDPTTIPTDQDGAGWLVAPSDGSLDTDSEQPAYAGLIIGRRYDILSETYELTLLLTNYRRNAFVRWRAPSADIIDNDTAKQYVEDPTVFYSLDGDGNAESDNNMFVVGDTVEAYEQTGELWTSTATWDIIAIGSDGTGEYIELDATVDLTGYLLRICDYDNFANDALFTGIDFPWTWFAGDDSPPTLGTNTDEAHYFG